MLNSKYIAYLALRRILNNDLRTNGNTQMVISKIKKLSHRDRLLCPYVMTTLYSIYLGSADGRDVFFSLCGSQSKRKVVSVKNKDARGSERN